VPDVYACNSALMADIWHIKFRVAVAVVLTYLLMYLLASLFVCASYLMHRPLSFVMPVAYFPITALANFAFKSICIVTPGSVTGV